MTATHTRRAAGVTRDDLKMVTVKELPAIDIGHGRAKTRIEMSAARAYMDRLARYSPAKRGSA
jgi:hypothetical protein